MLREIEGIEHSDRASYLRFSNMPVERTHCFADGEINVDLDTDGEVVGIEVLSLDYEELQTLADLAKKYRLSLTLLMNPSHRGSA